MFATWEWAALWWRHFGDGRAAVIPAHDEDGRLAALIPLYLSRGPLRIARFIGHGPGDQLGPVCGPADSACAELLPGTSKELGWHVLLAERLPAETGWGRSLGGRVLRREGNPVIDLEGVDWDGYLAERSRNFRSQLRRRERALLREGMTYRLSDEPERVEEDLESLFDLHRARWGRAASEALSGPRAAFHREFAELALERAWLRLWLAEVDGRPIAAWYGFRYGDVEWYYQLGRSPDWDRFSVGLVLLAHTIRSAIEEGVHEYRLLRGAESYKSRFATRDDGLDTLAFPGRAPGRLAVSAAALVLALPEPMRRPFTKRLG